MKIMVQIDGNDVNLKDIKEGVELIESEENSKNFRYTLKIVKGLVAKIEELKEELEAEKIYKEISQDFYNDY